MWRWLWLTGRWLSRRGSLLPWLVKHIYIYIYIYIVLSDERLGAKLWVTENRCVLFDSFTYIYIFFFFRKVTIDCQSDTSVSHLHFTYCAWSSCICFISLILIELIINCCFSFFYRKTDPDRVNNKSYSKETELKDF